MVFHLPLRQTEGFLRSLADHLQVDLPVPDHTTLSRRARRLGTIPFGCVATFQKRQESDWSSRPGSVSCRHLEQVVDELNLSPHIRTAHPPRLPLPDHVHGRVALDRSPRRLKLTKPLLGFHASFNRSMILLQDVVHVLDWPVAATASQESCLFHPRNCRAVETGLVRVDDAGLRMRRISPRLAEQACGRSGIAPPREHEVDRGAAGIDGSVEGAPTALDTNVGLIDTPGRIGWLEMTAQPFLQFGTVALDPVPNCRVVHFQAALAEQLFDIAERERIPKVPAHGAQNQLGLGLSPLKDRRSDCLLHDLFRLPAAVGQSCNTTNRADRRLRRVAGKSARIDAEAAARSVLAGQATATPKTADGAVEMIRQLTVARDTAVKARPAAMNTLKPISVNAPSVGREPLHGLTAQRLLARCAALRPGRLDTPTASAQYTLRALARRWFALAEEIATHDRHLARLTTETSPTLRAGFGVGANSAAEFLIVFGDNPERIRSEAAVAKRCGACPIPASSGRTTGRHRLYRGGHRQANAALYRSVIVRMRYHQPTVDYVVRRTADDRTKREIIRCLKRFLAREIYQRVMTDFRARRDVAHAA